MSEFVFKNLSVKLFPAEGLVDGECVCCSYEVACDACTHCTDSATEPPCGPCTNTVTVECTECTHGTSEPDTGPCLPCTGSITNDCFPCTDFETTPCFGPFSHDPPRCEQADSCGDGTGCLDTVPIFLPGDRSTAVVAQELGVLRTELRQLLGRSAEDDRHAPVEEAESLEEIDRLKDALLAAVAQLDERRAQVERDQRR